MQGSAPLVQTQVHASVLAPVRKLSLVAEMALAGPLIRNMVLLKVKQRVDHRTPIGVR